MQKRHRVFIAINLPEDIKKALSKYGEKFAELPAKWITKDNLHVTLVFLGDLTDQEIVDVCSIVGEVARLHSSLSVNLNKVLYGPTNKMPPKMVWAEGEKSEELAELKNDLQEELLEAVNFRPEKKGFTPHVTLARIKEWEFKKIEPEERPEVNENIDLVFTVESIEVMESVLKKGGPVYGILESRELKD
ncbi:MAG: RNA 2',3'-cyclic phosphodiesterase [bacterium]